MPPRIPLATYRLQFNRDFRFEDAGRLVPYLDALGITDLHASPLFAARAGSTHGYDVTDYARLNPELGSEGDFENLARALRERGMGLLLDMVPNHMGIDDPSNRWWEDVLRHGPGSAYAKYFDIDWDPPDETLKGKILLPVLGDEYDRVIDRGELRLALEEGRPFIRYFERRFPVCPGTADEAGSLIAGGAGAAERRERLDRILSGQFYRLAYWRDGLPRLNYRRFFDISHLAGVRVEDPEVFAATHALLLRLIGEGKVTGARVDHPDGLVDPEGYFERLQRGCERALRGKPPGRAAEAPKPPTCACFVVAEKILSEEEPLPTEWAVHGTTGYEFLNDLNALFVDPKGARDLHEVYSRFVGWTDAFRDVAYRSKARVLQAHLAAEARALSRRLGRIAEEEGVSRDIPAGDLQRALTAVIAAFPVYRTYAREGREALTAEERGYVARALAEARERAPQIVPAAIDLIERTLLAPPGKEADPGRMAFLLRFQQLSAPAMAKGVEDTAFYRHYPLLSSNEVGGDPERPCITIEKFHRRNAERLSRWPHAMSVTATHDTKRGEDARARLNVLSEMAADWEEAILRWREMNRGRRRRVRGREAPDANEEYLLYQSLAGAWPLEMAEDAAQQSFVERMKQYMTKALREAKLHTGWLTPDARYETAMGEFLQAILTPAGDNAFPEDFQRFQRRLARLGALNSLSQMLLKITSPGTPEFYQGTELWDLSLVDPDNRRPVDFDARKRILARLREAEETGERLSELLESWADGRIKLDVMRKALAHRRKEGALFTGGAYVPLDTRGSRADQVCAFARRRNGVWCVTAVARLLSRLDGEGIAVIGAAWKETQLFLPPDAPARWTNLLTGERIETLRVRKALCIPVRRLFRRIPVALLAARPA